MSLASQISALATRIATEFKTVRGEVTSGLDGKSATTHGHTITAKNGTEVPSSYPVGISMFQTSGSQTDWPATNGVVVTAYSNINRAVQTFTSKDTNNTYIRTCNTDVWSGWNMFSVIGHSHAADYEPLRVPVTLAEAQAGTGITARSWTPEKVGQAIAALGGSKNSPVRVMYGTSSYPIRPTGAVYVEWVGPVPPSIGTNAAQAGDSWVSTNA